MLGTTKTSMKSLSGPDQAPKRSRASLSEVMTRKAGVGAVEEQGSGEASPGVAGGQDAGAGLVEVAQPAGEVRGFEGDDLRPVTVGGRGDGDSGLGGTGVYPPRSAKPSSSAADRVFVGCQS
jgi:hypothetical protein